MLEALVGGVGSVLLLLGLGLATIGLYGLLRKPDIFEQLHAAGLVTGSGVILVLLASVASGRAEIVTSALLVVAFVLVTSSLSTHAIALAAWRHRTLPAETGASTGIRRKAVRRDEVGRLADPAAPMRVLVAYDASPAAELAVGLTASLQWPDGSVVLLVGVVGADLPSSAGAEPQPAPGEGNGSDLEPALGAAAGSLARPGLVIDHVVRRGDPATAIVDEARAFDAQLVVIGSRGLGPLRSLLMGSVATEVVDRAPCPVLVARSATVRGVLLATDGSEASNAAIELIGGWTIFAPTPIHVLSVGAEQAQIPSARGEGAAQSEDDVGRTPQQRAVDEAVVRLREAGLEGIPHVLSGDAVGSIVDLAEAWDIDLIVLGSRGRTGLTRTLLGSVASEVLSTTQRSVLVVRANEPIAVPE